MLATAALLPISSRGQTLQPTLDLSDLRVVVHWSTPSDLKEARVRYVGRGGFSRRARPP